MQASIQAPTQYLLRSSPPLLFFVSASTSPIDSSPTLHSALMDGVCVHMLVIGQSSRAQALGCVY